jgi:hypothetical protein
MAEQLPEPTPYPYTTDTEARLRLVEEQAGILREAVFSLLQATKEMADQVDALVARTVAGGG